MRIMVIPDIHGRKFWRDTISDYMDKVEKVVFLGDYLDPYPDEIVKNPELMECKSFDDVEALSKLLLDIINLKKDNLNKVILLTGNHSDSYIWKNFSAATRTDWKNWETYHNIFLENLNLFNLVYVENNTIFSHAGITEKWAKEFLLNCLEYEDLNIDIIPVTAKLLSTLILTNISNKYITYLGNVGFARGGYGSGSCEWADITEHIERITSYYPLKFEAFGDNKVFQVFGHSQLVKPLICDKWACIDYKKGFIIDTITHEVSEC